MNNYVYSLYLLVVLAICPTYLLAQEELNKDSINIDSLVILETTTSPSDNFATSNPTIELFQLQKELISTLEEQTNDKTALGKIYASIADLYFEDKQLDIALQYSHTAQYALSLDTLVKDFYSFPLIDQSIDDSLAFMVYKLKADIFKERFEQSKDQNDLEGAFALYESINNYASSLQRQYNLNFTNKEDNYKNTFDLLIKLYDLTTENKYIEQAFTLAENKKALVIEKITPQVSIKNFAAIPQTLLLQEDSIKTNSTLFYQDLKKAKHTIPLDSNRLQILQDTLFQLLEGRVILAEQFKEDYPSYYDLNYIDQSFSVTQIQEQLDEHTALLEYVDSDTILYVFTITKEDFKIHSLAKPINFDQDLMIMSAYCSSPTFYEEDATAAFTKLKNLSFYLYNQVVEKPLSSISEKQQVVIIPDGVLWSIPFELFLTHHPEDDFRNWPYLFKRTGISYANSARMYCNSLKPLDDDLAYKLFAGFAPSFSDEKIAAERSCSDEALADIDNANEIKSIKRLLDSGRLFSGRYATQKSFIEKSKDFKVIHLATHACIDDENPMLSKIYFSDNEYLTTQELYTIETNAEMMVLSACETGVGAIKKGEGVMSLARGFMYAGCPSITMSLWSVNDASTSTIMQSYYKRLDEGLSKSLALRQAKLDFLAEASAEQLPPYYWAPFVHFGNDRVIDMSKRVGMSDWVVTLALIAFLAFLLRNTVEKKSTINLTKKQKKE